MPCEGEIRSGSKLKLKKPKRRGVPRFPGFNGDLRLPGVLGFQTPRP